uniref:Uncharacterized protein n=1 Tax=Glossina pallidipes TaxID=7398 RepID=A0A1B0ADS5_GLOPL
MNNDYVMPSFVTHWKCKLFKATPTTDLLNFNCLIKSIIFAPKTITRNLLTDNDHNICKLNGKRLNHSCVALCCCNSYSCSILITHPPSNCNFSQFLLPLYKVSYEQCLFAPSSLILTHISWGIL